MVGYLLKREDDVIRTLERQYRYALRNINEKIRLYQADEQTVSRVHHINFQKQLKSQIEAELEKLHSGEYTTIQQYLDDTYTDSYIGNMYDLAGQGVPVIAPIDKNAAIKAVTTDSKLSTDLYNSLGVDLRTLKKSVRNEITRGIASGMLYSDIARNVAAVTGSPLNRAKTIVRTEGHRIQEASRHDACIAAKAKGADLVRQWEARLDNKTRPTHRQLDGQIVEVDQPFTVDGKEAMRPGAFDDPAEDCNCRCMALTRARKALMNPDELKRMQERAAFFGLDKTQDFEAFREKYLKAVEAENSMAYTESEKITKSMAYAVDPKVVQSRTYADKFASMTTNPQERREYLKAAKEMLQHRSGQNGEDLYLYNKATKQWTRSITGTEAATPEYTQAILNTIKKAQKGQLAAFHNHPASMPPSDSDLNAALQNGYGVGYILCHNGTIFEYTAPKDHIPSFVYDLHVADLKKRGYNEYEAQIKALEELSGVFNFVFREVR